MTCLPCVTWYLATVLSRCSPTGSSRTGKNETVMRPPNVRSFHKGSPSTRCCPKVICKDGLESIGNPLYLGRNLNWTGNMSFDPKRALDCLQYVSHLRCLFCNDHSPYTNSFKLSMTRQACVRARRRDSEVNWSASTFASCSINCFRTAVSCAVGGRQSANR